MKYYYFLSFNCKNDKGSAFGNGNFILDTKLRTNKEITDMQIQIGEENDVKNVIIMNIVLLDSEEII